MSAAAASFAAVEAIAKGEWDRYLLSIGIAVNQRLAVLGTSLRQEHLLQFEEAEKARVEIIPNVRTLTAQDLDIESQ